jgi:type II secretory pathway pseudopilin PulG
MKKAFTIMELLVAVGLLAAVLAVSSMIFSYSIDAQRTASATAEIMRTLRAITDQLNIDFAGIRSDMPFGVEFVKVVNGSDEIRVDSIVFFAAGDFQTTKQYNSQTVRGNVARIYYGQSVTPEPNSFDTAVRRNKILARKQVILTSDSSLPLPDDANEYQITSPEEQLREAIQVGSIPPYWRARPNIDPNDENDIPLYFAKGVDNFSIMLDEDVNSTTRSIDWWPQTSDMPANMSNYSKPYPDLIKFTFTLYDSKGIIKNGRRFEHIVYIGK